MPLRQPDPVQDTQRIYRRFRFGDLIELHMLDTRLQGREQQNGTGNTSPTRTLLGFPQFDWLIEGMDTSTARWQILGQQVMMGPLNVQPLTFLPPIYPNADQWDGYSGERKRLYDSVMARNISNMVVLTGDIHTAWAMDLPMVNYVGASGANSAGVEFVTTAVTSQSSPLPISISVIQSINPHIKFADLTRKGYLILDVNRQRTQGDFYFVSTISQIGATETLGASWFVNNGERFLRRANSGSVANPARVGVQAPLNPRFTGSQDTTVSIDLVAEDKSSVLLGIYPNPFMEQLQLHYTLQYDAEVSAMVVDMQGRTVWQWEGGQQPQGIHRQSLQPQGLSTGSYVLVLRLGKQQYQRILVKQ
jgi:alkaline phosphatase D